VTSLLVSSSHVWTKIFYEIQLRYAI